MHKKGQMVHFPLWLMGALTEVTGGWVQINIVSILLSLLALFHRRLSNLTPATLVSVLLQKLRHCCCPLWLHGQLSFSLSEWSTSVKLFQATKINTSSGFYFVISIRFCVRLKHPFLFYCLCNCGRFERKS